MPITATATVALPPSHPHEILKTPFAKAKQHWGEGTRVNRKRRGTA